MVRDRSPEHDDALIDDIACYLRDPRYLRVDGRPLLVVDRPRRLPDPRATAERWRERCRLRGIGDIMLACSEECGRDEPSVIGFDAAIAFASDVGGSPEITGTVRRLNPEFRGHVYDYRRLVVAHDGDSARAYPYFPTVSPGLDDQARNPGSSRIYLHAAPRRYETWLSNVLRDLVHRVPEQDRRLIFVNAWNRWAEGAYLEPDARLGYAYLAATRRALTRAAADEARQPDPSGESRPVCVVIHAYYPELLDEMLPLLGRWPLAHRLIVTTVPEVAAAVKERLAPLQVDAELRVHENRGRDVLPFLRVANELADRGEWLVVKLHTKRSQHRADGDDWRRELLAKLMAVRSARRCRAAFAEFPRLGMLAPEAHIVSMRSYWDDNRDNVHYLCRRLGIAEADPEREIFAAGSMFWARLDALRPLLDLHLDEAEFEAEEGQVDGTMAHAIERVLPLAVRQAGLYFASTSAPAVEAHAP
jgi:lipopolysaccharide biosynthesis protein